MKLLAVPLFEIVKQINKQLLEFISLEVIYLIPSHFFKFHEKIVLSDDYFIFSISLVSSIR